MMRKDEGNNTFREREIVRLITVLLIAVIICAVLFTVMTAVSVFRGDPDGGSEGSQKNGDTTEAVSGNAGQESSAGGSSGEGESKGPESEKTDESETENDLIHTLSGREIETIEKDFSGEVYGFGLGLDPVKDENGRPVQVNSLLERFEGSDVMPVCYCADADTPAVAFTFQAGMETGYTENVLDILDRYGIRSTFYINHSFAAKSADLVQRMIEDGHEIGNHSYNCPDDGIASEGLWDQMADAINLQDFVRKNYHYEMRKYNFNSGIWSEQAIALMDRMGYEVCFCSSNYSDYYSEKEYSKEKVLSDLKNNLHNGCVYCFHMTNPVTEQFLPELIEFCLEQGYSIVQLN